jgi:hypothetical protein
MRRDRSRKNCGSAWLCIVITVFGLSGFFDTPIQAQINVTPLPQKQAELEKVAAQHNVYQKIAALLKRSHRSPLLTTGPSLLENAVVIAYEPKAKHRAGYLENDFNFTVRFVLKNQNFTFEFWPDTQELYIISIDRAFYAEELDYPVPTVTTDSSGFRINGINDSAQIRQLESLGNTPIAMIERRMQLEINHRPSYLTVEESLPKLLADDNDFVRLRELTHQKLAAALLYFETLYERGYINKPGPYGPIARVIANGLPFEVSVHEMIGCQHSPFDDNDNQHLPLYYLEITNLVTGRQIFYNNLLGIFVQAYGFYGGHRTDFREDPEKIIAVFGLLPVALEYELATDPVARLILNSSQKMHLATSDAVERLERLANLDERLNRIDSGDYQIDIRDYPLLSYLAYSLGEKPKHPSLQQRIHLQLSPSSLDVPLEDCKALVNFLVKLPDEQRQQILQAIKTVTLPEREWDFFYELAELLNVARENAAPSILSTVQFLLGKMPAEKLDPMTLTKALWRLTENETTIPAPLATVIDKSLPQIQRFWERQFRDNGSFLTRFGLLVPSSITTASITIDEISDLRSAADKLVRQVEESTNFARQFGGKNPTNQQVLGLLGLLERLRNSPQKTPLAQADQELLDALQIDPALLPIAFNIVRQERTGHQDPVQAPAEAVFFKLFNAQAKNAYALQRAIARLPATLPEGTRQLAIAILDREIDSRSNFHADDVERLLSFIEAPGLEDSADLSEKVLLLMYYKLSLPEFGDFFSSDYIDWSIMPKIERYNPIRITINRQALDQTPVTSTRNGRTRSGIGSLGGRSRIVKIPIHEVRCNQSIFHYEDHYLVATETSTKQPNLVIDGNQLLLIGFGAGR